MLLVVDANAIAAKPLLTGSNWNDIRAAVVSGSIELVVPELAVLEAVAVFIRAHQVKITSIRKLLRTSSGTVRERLLAAIAALESEKVGYEELLRSSLEDVGATVVDLPHVSHGILTAKAIARKPPFDDGGGGYRDALQWHSLLEAAQTTEMPEVVLVSADKRAFGEPRQSELALELMSVNSEIVLRVVTGIEAVEIPGLFSDRTDMFDQHLERQLLLRLDRLLDVRGDVSELLDPDSDFDSATVRSIERISIADARTREYYTSRDLQIQFECSVECLVDLTFVQIDDDELDYREVHHAERWRILWSGEAFTRNQGATVEDKIELAPTSMVYLGDEFESSE